MRSVFLAIALLIATACSGEPCVDDKQIIVRSDKNVDVVAAAFEISPSGFGNWGDSGFVRPEADALAAYLESFHDHEAVAAVGQLVADGFWLDRLMRFAMEAPSISDGQGITAWSADLAIAAGIGDEAAGRERLDVLYRLLTEFNDDAGLDAFFQSRQDEHECAIAQIEDGLPEGGLIAAVENWYGDHRESYEIIIAPSIYATMGFGVQYGPANAPRIANIAAPFIQTDTLDEYGCGYGRPERVTELSRHEFGHSFVEVEEVISSMSPAVIERLHGPIAEAMESQGYSAWQSIVEEHIVRLGEIRIAVAMGEAERAEALRRDYIENRSFIYLPALEAVVLDYETHRDRWPSLSDFMPELIAAISSPADHSNKSK